jgi:hypothetical protein
VWKRGHLLYSTPGTGKSTMIVVVANYLDYDVYDIKLTSVRTNTDLRKLFIETTSKSITAIEDIDCSLDLTSKRKKKNQQAVEGDDAESSSKDGGDKKDGAEAAGKEEEEDKSASKVTHSGLLNFIDGI